MEIYIRKALPSDAEKAVPLIIEAIGDIAKRLTGETEMNRIEGSLVELFHKSGNRHSYRFTHVAEMNGEVAGIMVLYPGDLADELDRKLKNLLQLKGSAVTDIDQEALPGELYIDTICTDQKFRGYGVGTALLQHADRVAKESGYHIISLNVETEKEAAIRLYERIGFKIASPWTIIGEPFYHMVKELT